jgi:hypothetical protein
MKKEINELKEENKQIKEELQNLKNNNIKKEEEIKKINLPAITNNFNISSNPKIIELGRNTQAKVTMDSCPIDKDNQNKIWYTNNAFLEKNLIF